jgi:hypothetical protein
MVAPTGSVARSPVRAPAEGLPDAVWRMGRRGLPVRTVLFHYAEQAVRQHGTLRGAWLTLARLSRCQPFHRGGYDPVPPAAGNVHGRGTKGDS